jgi:hypothetical protein
MRARPLLVALSAAGVTGCAAIAHSSNVDPRDQLAHAAAALEAQDYARARELLEPLYFQHWMEPVGQQAQLMLIAAELDGRNPNRRLWAAADMATRLLQIPSVEPWVVPLAESYYVLAVELGATEERVALAEAARADAEERAVRAERASTPPRRLPTTTRETVPAQLRRVNRDRDELKRQVEQLQQQVEERDRDLREARQELERIKKTIKP